MALPVPNLDDRRFQDLVDDAKRLVQQRCPEWTDHNVSDPGVTLIEAFAFMTDQLLYRLNRVPERHYRKFLDLIGVRLFPPTAARAPLTFYLTAPQPETVRIAAGTQAATVRTETDEAIVFTTLDDLPIVPCSFSCIATGTAGSDAGSGRSGSGGSGPAASEGEGPKAGAGGKSAASAAPVDRTDQLAKEKAFEAFQPVPQPGDVLLVGLSDPIPSCAVSLRFRCSIEGVGVDPENPPVAWEAWTGEAWTACELERDSTGGLNRDGEVLLHVPAGHTASLVAKQRAGWIRARVVPVEEGQTAYSASPKIQGVTAATVGGTTTGVHAEVVTNEIVGASAGVGGERFQLLRRPVVPGDRPTVLRVSTDDGWEDWTQVPDFASSSATDRQFVLDAEGGEILLGPGVREADGSYRQFGAVPAKGARLQVAEYLTGGGRRGNVATGAVVVLRSSIPFVGRVANRHPGLGGVDGEDVENAKVRGPISLRTRGRAVTAEDYEQIVREAAPEVARVRAVPATDGPEAGSVRVLVVPAAESIAGQLRFEQLVPAEETLARITARLDECRVIGARVLVEPPAYRGITIVARLKPRPRVNPTRLQAEAAEALATYFHPILGGPTGDGWPFGRPVQIGEVYAVLQALPGTEIVEDARLFGADPITGQRGQPTQRLDLEPNALVFSYEHQLMVEGA